ncbi:replication-relaxation family protein [Candidatus Latescibacterota bacterium]
MPALKTKDFEYLNFIAEYRLLTNDMLAFLSVKSLRTIQHRISILDTMGLLSLSADYGKARRGKPRNIISLSPAGIEAVADTLDKDIRDIFYQNMNKKIIHIEHDLLTNLFRLHLIQLARHTHNFSTDFIAPTSPLLKCRKDGKSAISDTVTVDKKERSFVPDGVFSIFRKDEKKRLLFFLESDRSSESMNVTTDSANLKTKLENYHQYICCSGYKRYEKKWDNLLPGFRLLILCDSNKRKRQLAQFVSQFSALDYVWISDIDSLVTLGIGEKIWIRGGNSSLPLQSILGPNNVCNLPPVFSA